MIVYARDTVIQAIPEPLSTLSFYSLHQGKIEATLPRPLGGASSTLIL